MSDNPIKADVYKIFGHREHVYVVPDTYVGSVRAINRIEWLLIYDASTNSFRLEAKHANITVPLGVERVFYEILSNAGDNAIRSRKLGYESGVITVSMNKKTITVINGGLPIPIEINKESGILVPELIFGHLLTGSSYTGDRLGAGRNGYGAKLTNIFSKKFTVEVYNKFNKKQFIKTWYDNMTRSDAALIQEYNGNSSVNISYDLDFDRFGMQEYTDETIALFARLCADVAATLKIDVIFNGQRFHFPSISAIAPVYFRNFDKGFMLHLWPPNTKTVKKGKIYVAEDTTVAPIADIYLLDTSDNNCVISFVNGMMTRDGGVHIDALMKVLSKKILDNIKQHIGTKKKSGETRERFPLTVADIRNNVSVIASFYLVNPEFTSQSKTCLAAPEVSVNIPDDVLTPIFKWDLMSRLQHLIDMKGELKLAKETDGKKKRYLGGSIKCDDCNFAGTNRSTEAVLYVMEGWSASQYGNYLRDALPNGNDIIGILPVSGKFINVTAASLNKISKNKEIIELKQALGLVEGTDYSIISNYRKLRYGGLVLAADADDDGIHIKGLILNYCVKKYLSLFKLPTNFVSELQVPIVKVKIHKMTYSFYTMGSYQKAVENNPVIAATKARYYKGLGTSSKEDVFEDAKNQRLNAFKYDDAADETLTRAFDKRYTDHRKKQIDTYKEREFEDNVRVKNITDFINIDLIKYSVTNVRRSIPQLMDGLKVSQRKILWVALCTWKTLYTQDVPEMNGIKVAIFSDKVSGDTAYHHGEVSLGKTVIGMAQDFVGANNMAYLRADGQFGTRFKGGKDASAPRYLYTRPNWWLRYVYRKEDAPLLKLINDEGVIVEPEVFYPVIPMVLVNGANGIATGYSTSIPNYNPLDIIKWYQARLKGEPVIGIYPWYKEFNGVIEILDRNTKKKVIIDKDGVLSLPVVTEELTETASEDTFDKEYDSDREPDDDETDSKPVSLSGITINIKQLPPRRSMITKGVFEVKADHILVSELPIGRWTRTYSTWLESLASQNIIKDFIKTGDTEHPSFKIYGFPHTPNVHNLKLVKTYGMTNMTLLDADNLPKKYETVDDILEEFFKLRLNIYIKRKEYILCEIENIIKVYDMRCRFIRLVAIDKLIIIEQRPEADIYADMDKHGITDHTLLKDVKLINLTQESINKLQKKIEIKRQEQTRLSLLRPEDLWLSDLDELQTKYIAHNK